MKFSPKIHHAIAFADKHHEGQRRKGRNTAYITHPFNVALILARYGRPELDIIAGILHDVIEDCVTEQNSVRDLEGKINEKFGPSVLEAILFVTEEKLDLMGVKLDVSIRRERYLDNLEGAPAASLWVCAADKIHNGSSLIVDLLQAENRDAVWNAFSGGKQAVVAWYRAVYDRLKALGFNEPIMEELNYVASTLEVAAVTNVAQLPSRGSASAPADLSHQGSMVGGHNLSQALRASE